MKMLVSEDPDALWQDFAGAHGPDVIARAYRTPGYFPVHGERVWECYEGPWRVGWGSLIADPMSQNYLYRAGVWPEFARQGVRQRIRRLLVEEAFKNPDCQVVTTAALLSNPVQVARLQGESVSGKWAQFSGIVWYPPPGMVLFTMTRALFATLTAGGVTDEP